MDKHKENDTILEEENLLYLAQEVVQMPQKEPELLHPIYQEISEALGMESALVIYRLFKGQQITFPVRFFHPQYVRQRILQEYDGSNIKKLAIQYGYSEKTIRRFLNQMKEDPQ